VARSRSRFALLLGGATLLLGTRCPPAALAEDADEISKDWVEVATVEHSRGDPQRLWDFVEGGTGDPIAHKAAVRAFGRLGDQPYCDVRLTELLRRNWDMQEAQLGDVIDAAGISRIRSLAPYLLTILEGPHASSEAGLSARPPHGDKRYRAWRERALWSLGQVADIGSEGYVRQRLASSEPKVAAAALDAIWRIGDERSLEDVMAKLADEDFAVRREAAFATWRLAGVRRKAKSKPDAPWAGDPALAWKVVVALANGGGGPETRLALLRALNTLTPKTLVRAEADGHPRPDAVLLDAVRHKDPRIAADVAFRLGGAHNGPDVEAALGVALTHADPLVRETAAEALGTLGTEGAGKVLAVNDESHKEGDERVMAEITVARTACAGETDAKILPADAFRTLDPLHTRTQLRILLASKSNKAEEQLAERLPQVVVSDSLRAEIYGELADDKRKAGTHDWTDEAIRGLVNPDFVVRSNAVALLVKQKPRWYTNQDFDQVVAVLGHAYDKDLSRGSQDVRAAIAEKVLEITTLVETDVHARPSDVPARILFDRALKDPSPLVRWTARKAREKVPALEHDAEESAEPHPNEWRGLPRPKGPILGLDLHKGEGWLNEEEILRLAETIRVTKARVAIETSWGTIVVELDAEQCPVHAANLVLCAAGGVYDGTIWHRVVPAFVIQGGDPHGDGSGDAGYAIPDEITTTRFERGVLGMPKGDMKDTGGCQLFFMHCAAPHLDGAYTAYGRAVEGLDAIDKIRVGDKIVKATVVLPPPGGWPTAAASK
jgi:cyclophilin family peptidyl-prolyl cis-trans isomerase/HEAT repeat protein